MLVSDGLGESEGDILELVGKRIDRRDVTTGTVHSRGKIYDYGRVHSEDL
ncbi:hypothetical protein TcasGA2_TC008192 [Tribolium castaneum]|uniref:Uncharacterized protein n=1 Tax=Tribolium castaneum TaxID=7070 RepID=D2A0C7_TRICA|nr:hypothetical protein TcasGA2_TC008192 [Tribolium castaneum]